jgi:hypothetical protein
MSLNFKDAKKGMTTNLAPVGNHIARCYQIIDLGTQESSVYKNASHKVRFSWELCEEMADFGKGKKEPYAVHRTLNFFVGKNSNLQKLLEGWKGGTFTEAEWEVFDLRKLVGRPCMINVVHVTSNDTDYANVASVSPIPAKWKDKVPPLVNKGIYFEIEMGRNAEFQALPEFLQKMIEKCTEWKGGGTATNDDDDPFADLRKEDTENGEDEETKAGNAAAAEAGKPSKRIQPQDDDIPF